MLPYTPIRIKLLLLLLLLLLHYTTTIITDNNNDNNNYNTLIENVMSIRKLCNKGRLLILLETDLSFYLCCERYQCEKDWNVL